MCGLCSGAVQFVLARDHSGIFLFAPIQSETGRRVSTAAGLQPDAPSTFIVAKQFGSVDERVLTESRAVLFVAQALGWPWSMAGLFGAVPTSLLDRIYKAVAANRYRLFGKREQCFVPKPEHRNRFIDSVTR
jgi:predicted DCC family thiol-disulfide oxidoreductase YuxK